MFTTSKYTVWSYDNSYTRVGYFTDASLVTGSSAYRPYVGYRNSLSHHAFIYFPSVLIQKDSITPAVRLLFQSNISQYSNTLFRVHLVKEINPVFPTTLSECLNWNLTPGVVWDATNFYYGENSTIDFSSEFSQLVTDPNWVLGSSVIVVIKNESSESYKQLYNQFSLEIGTTGNKLTSSIKGTSGNHGCGFAGLYFHNSYNPFVGVINPDPVRTFARFDDFQLDNKVKINNASVYLTAGQDADVDMQGVISCVNADDPYAPTTIGELDSLSLTTTTAFDLDQVLTNSQKFNIGVVTNGVQQVVNRSGFNDQSAIIVVIDTNVSTGTDEFFYITYDGIYLVLDLSYGFIPGQFEITDEFVGSSDSRAFADVINISDLFEAGAFVTSYSDIITIQDNFEASNNSVHPVENLELADTFNDDVVQNETVSIKRTPQVSGDDGYWFYTTSDGHHALYNNSIALLLGHWLDDWTKYNLFIRFPNITIPQNAIILSAKILFKSTKDYAAGSFSTIKIACVDSDDAVAPTTYDGAEALALTSGTMWYVNGAIYTDVIKKDCYFYSEDFSPEVQSIVNRGGFTSGNAIEIAMLNQAVNGNYDYLSFYSYDATNYDGPEIEIIYTTSQYGRDVETVQIVDLFSGELVQGTYESDFTDDIIINDLYDPGVIKDSSFGEIFNLSDLFNAENNIKSCDQDINFVDDLLVYRKVGRSTIDSLIINDLTRLGFYKLTIDNIILIDNLVESLGLLISDWLKTVDSCNDNGSFQLNVFSILTTFDISTTIKIIYNTIIDSVDITEVQRLNLGIKLLDVLILIESYTFNGIYSIVEVDKFNVYDSIVRSLSTIVNDVILVSDNLLSKYIGSIITNDNIEIIDENLSIDKVNLFTREEIFLNDVNLIKQIITQYLQDGLSLELSIILNTEEYQCLVLNTDLFHPSIYSNNNWNSLTKFNNVSYGAEPTGVYKLSGLDDDNIEIIPGIIWRKSDFHLKENKKLRMAYIGYNGNNPAIQLETENGTQVFNVVKAKTYFRRDLLGKQWVLTLQNFDEVEFIKLYPVVLTR